MLFRMFVIITALSLSACGAVAPVPTMQHYLLDVAPKQNSGSAGAQIAQVRVISMPDYLNQSSLVMMVDDHRMQIARYHSWADRLNDSVARIVEYEYNKRLASGVEIKDCQYCYSIALSIEHFYPTSEGDVYLVGYYQYETEQRETVKQRFNLSGKMKADGYQAAVAEMRALLVLLSQQIAEQSRP